MTSAMTDRDEREILSIASARQQAEDDHADAGQSRAALREAAAEVGIAAHHVAAAEDIVAQRRAAERVRSAGRRRAALVAGAVIAVAAVGGLAWRFTVGRPAVAWHDTMDAPAAWVLDVSVDTDADLRWVDVPGRGSVAEVSVAAARPRDDGTWFVNLDRQGVPGDASRHDAVVVELEGTLPAARVYLEAGADERWRSPPIAVQPTWTRHRIALDSFEHQRRVDGQWRAAGGGAPEGLTALSIKVGWFVNAPTATGALRVAEVGLE
jgi:hypothetical protein